MTPDIDARSSVSAPASIIADNTPVANPTHANPPVAPAHLRAILVALDFADTGRGASVDDFQRRSGVAVEDFGRGLLQLSNQGFVADWGKSKWYGPGYSLTDAGRAFMAQPAPAESPAPVAAEPARADSTPVKATVAPDVDALMAEGLYLYDAFRREAGTVNNGAWLDFTVYHGLLSRKVIAVWEREHAQPAVAPVVHWPRVTPTRAVCVALAPYYPDIVGIAGRLAVAEARARKAAPRPYAAWMPAATHVHPVIVDPVEERAITETMFAWARESDDWDLAAVALNRALGDAETARDPWDVDSETADRLARYAARRDPQETPGWSDPFEGSSVQPASVQ